MVDLRLILFFIVALLSQRTFASGMVPETSLLLMEESEHEATIKLTNTDKQPALLYTKIIDVPDDTGNKIIVTEPVTRVEAGGIQQVHFILIEDKVLKTEHLKRVVFEGIPIESETNRGIRINIRQNLPVLIHPTSLPVVRDAWKYLKWSVNHDYLEVRNPSAYVIRLSEIAELKPSGKKVNLGRNYILPNQQIEVKISNNGGSDNQVTFSPASRYGFAVETFTTNLVTVQK